MFGGSYGGGVQFAAAKDDKRIDALVPVITWNDLEYALGPNNADFAAGVTPDTPGVFKRVWADLFAVFGVLRGLEYALGDPRRLVGCPNFVEQVCPTLIKANVLGYVPAPGRALLRHASVASFVDEIDAPTLLIQGEDDTLFNLQEAIATYRGLKASGTTVRMIWQSWGHSGAAPAPGEFDPSMTRAPETTYLGRRVLDWFAHWLRDDASKQLGPEISYFRDWVSYNGSLPAGAEPAYGTADSYPIGSTQRLYLSGNRTLTPGAGGVVAGRQTYANLPAGVPSSYSELPPFDLAAPPFDLPGSFASWTSAPLTENVDTVGVPTLDVKLTSPIAAITQLTGTAGKLVVFAKIYDVAPDGSIDLVDRLVSPARVPNVNAPVRIELPGVVHRYEAGHRIRVVLAASDSAYGGNLSVLPVTIQTTSASVPVLTLPVVGAGRVG
jgi:ABC-2 type transport system ATP-binding protein